MQAKQQNTTLAILVSVFFFWGFVAASNDLLIPVFKKALDLTQVQSQMISFCFYVAYTIGAVIYFLLSKVRGRSIIDQFGPNTSISIGLCVSAVGAFLFYPAAVLNSFGIMLAGLFIVGLGFSLQQTAANPFAISLGTPETGSQRLSLAGGINNLGTTIGPLLLAYVVFGGSGGGAENATIDDVKIPYLVLGLAFLLAAAVFYFTRPKTPVITGITAEDELALQDSAKLGSVFRFKQLPLGMIAIFVYVGVEVSTVANLPEYMVSKLGFSEGGTAPFVALFWGSLMIGRWAAATAALTTNKVARMALKVVVPYVAFGLFLLFSHLSGNEIEPFYNYAFIIPIMIIADFATREKPYTMLLLYSLLGIIALLIGINTDGMTAVYAIMSVGLFLSTLWPCIFTLAISGLGKQADYGSNFLIMMIMGGGIISLFQGYLVDLSSVGIQNSYFVGVACFAYLIYYALVTGPIHKRNTELAKTTNL